MPQPTPFDAILAQSRDLFRDRLCAAVGEMFDGTDESLTALAEKTADEELQKRYLVARDVVLANREGVESQFRIRLMGEFQKRTNSARKIGTSLADFSMDDLQLVGDDDLNETLKFNDMAAKVRRYCEEELGALDQRVGVLLGDASLEAEDNPFGPQVICDAYKHACRQVDCPVDVRAVFLKLFDDHVLDTIRSSYKDVNDLLVENSILPKIRYGIAKSESKAPAPGTPEEAAAAERTATRTGEDMFAMLSKMIAPGAGGPGGAGAGHGMGMGGAPLVQGQALMGSLTSLQVGDLEALGAAAAELGPILAQAGNLKNVLHQLKSTSVGAGLGQTDTMTLDIVARLFDELFDDPKVHVVMKSLIGRLQLPMLKVAIADKDLFTNKAHPARQLLDVLGQIGMRLPAEFNDHTPLFARLETFIQELVEGFREKLEIFDKVRGELEAIIAEDDQRVARDMQATEKQLQQSESLAMAKAVAQGEIRRRVVAAAKPPPRAVVQFLAQQWIKYLVIVHARDGAESPAWKAALESIDQLLASVLPRATPEDQRVLAKIVPGLLKALRAGMASAGVEDEVAKAFFSELMKCHTEVMHTHADPVPMPPPKKDKAGGAAPKPVAKPTDSAVKRPAPLTPAAAADASAAADALDFTAPVSVNNPFGTGKVDVSADDLDFTEAGDALAADEAPAPATAGPARGTTPSAKPAATARAPKSKTIRLPSAMVVGAWVEIVTSSEDDARIPAKLHYMSPMKSHFLFVDRKGNKAYECSRSMLARRIKLGEVSMLDGEPDASLFDRIMGGLFGKLRSAAPA